MFFFLTVWKITNSLTLYVTFYQNYVVLRCSYSLRSNLYTIFLWISLRWYKIRDVKSDDLHWCCIISVQSSVHIDTFFTTCAYQSNLFIFTRLALNDKYVLYDIIILFSLIVLLISSWQFMYKGTIWCQIWTQDWDKAGTLIYIPVPQSNAALILQLLITWVPEFTWTRLNWTNRILFTIIFTIHAVQ